MVAFSVWSLICGEKQVEPAVELYSRPRLSVGLPDLDPEVRPGAVPLRHAVMVPRVEGAAEHREAPPGRLADGRPRRIVR